MTAERFTAPGRRNGAQIIWVFLVAIVLMALLVTILWWRAIQTSQRFEAEANLRATLAQASDPIEREISALGLQVDGLISAVELSPELVEQNWEKLASDIVRANEAIINIALIPDFIITRVYPEEQNRAAIGIDISERPQQYELALQSLAADAVLFDGPVALVQGFPGLIVRGPVTDVLGQEPGEAWGLVSLVLHFERFLDTINFERTLDGYEWQLVKLADSGEIEILRSSGPEDLRGALGTRIQIPGQSWELRARPLGGWALPLTSRHAAPVAFLLVTICFIGLSMYWQREAQRRRAAEDRLGAAIEALTDGFALYDHNDRLVTCNEQYRRMYKISNHAIRVGATFEEIIREGVANGQYQSALGREEEWIKDRIAVHQAANSDHEQQLADGRWVRVADRRVSDGSIVGFRVDITDLKAAKEEAEAASRAKTEFLGTLSHELRTPLTIILGHAGLIEGMKARKPVRALFEELEAEAPDISVVNERLETLVDQTASQAHLISSSSTHLLDLINEILDYSRIESGTFKLEKERVRVDELVRQVARGMEVHATQKGLTLDVDTTPTCAHVDKTRLRQVIINITGNAIKFTETGGVVIGVRENDGLVELTISDTGRGIPEEYRDRIFEAFEQVSQLKSRSSEGVGLGLAISRKLIRMHDGEITVAPVETGGTVFTITIPAVSEA